MNYYTYGLTRKGKYNQNNKDTILIDHITIRRDEFGLNCTAPFITAICDGMGGESSGELTSQYCTTYLAGIAYNSSIDIDANIMSIHNRIRKKGISIENSKNMQTTLCMLAIDENNFAKCYNVGNSKMFRYVNRSISQISDNRNYKKSDIVPSLGNLIHEIDIQHTELGSYFGKYPDDTIIICSDGLSDYVSMDEIRIILRPDYINFPDKLKTLCDLAVYNGSTDDISIVGIKTWDNRKDYLKLFENKETKSIKETNNNIGNEQEDNFENSVETEEKTDKLEINININLKNQADNSLAHLFEDLEKFKSE